MALMENTSTDAKVKKMKPKSRKHEGEAKTHSSLKVVAGDSMCRVDGNRGKVKNNSPKKGGKADICTQNDPWILDIDALLKEAKDFPGCSVTGYGMTTYQNIEKGDHYIIKLGCRSNNDDPFFHIHVDTTVMVGSECEPLDFEAFDRAYRLVRALKENDYDLNIWGSAVECDLGVSPDEAQCHLNELKRFVVEIFGQQRSKSILRSTYSYEELEWDPDGRE